MNALADVPERAAACLIFSAVSGATLASILSVLAPIAYLHVRTTTVPANVRYVNVRRREARLDDEEFKSSLRQWMLPLVYERARVARQKTCPIGELLGRDEDQFLEFKSTLRWDLAKNEKSKAVEGAVLKTVAAFLNSRHGGTLLIGVANDRSIVGLDGDYATLRKEGRDDSDLFQLHLTQVIENAAGQAATANVSSEILTVDGREVCRVHVDQCGHPVRAKIATVDAKGQHAVKEAFFVRYNNATREITDEREIERYISQRWARSSASNARNV